MDTIRRPVCSFLFSTVFLFSGSLRTASGHLANQSGSIECPLCQSLTLGTEEAQKRRSTWFLSKELHSQPTLWPVLCLCHRPSASKSLSFRYICPSTLVTVLSRVLLKCILYMLIWLAKVNHVLCCESFSIWSVFFFVHYIYCYSLIRSTNPWTKW